MSGPSILTMVIHPQPHFYAQLVNPPMVVRSLMAMCNAPTLSSMLAAVPREESCKGKILVDIFPRQSNTQLKNTVCNIIFQSETAGVDITANFFTGNTVRAQKENTWNTFTSPRLISQI